MARVGDCAVVTDVRRHEGVDVRYGVRRLSSLVVGHVPGTDLTLRSSPPCTRSVFHETLRLFPPVSSRQPVELAYWPTD